MFKESLSILFYLRSKQFHVFFVYFLTGTLSKDVYIEFKQAYTCSILMNYKFKTWWIQFNLKYWKKIVLGFRFLNKSEHEIEKS